MFQGDIAILILELCFLEPLAGFLWRQQLFSKHLSVHSLAFLSVSPDAKVSSFLLLNVKS